MTMITSLLFAASMLIADGAAQPTALSTRAGVARMVAEAPQITEVQLSPNAAALVYTVSRGSVTTNQIVTELFLQHLTDYGAARGAPVLLATRTDGDQATLFTPRWCPKSDCVSYFGRTNDDSQSAQLIRHDLTAGRATPILIKDGTAAQIGEDYQWSPSGALLAFTGYVDKSLLDRRRGVSIPPGKEWTTGTGVLFVLDVASGSVTQLTPETLSVDAAGGWSWAPDESAIVFATTTEDEDRSIRVEMDDLYVVERMSRAVRPLVLQPGADFRPAWSPDGRWIAFSSSRGKEGSRMQGIHLSVVPAGGGPIINLQAESDPSIWQTKIWGSDSRSIVFTAAHRMNLWLYWTTMPNAVDSSITPPVSLMEDMTTFHNRQFSFSADARRVAIVRNRGARASELYVGMVSAHGLTQLQQITHINDSLPFGEPVRLEAISWPSEDGKITVHGMLLTPEAAWKGGRIAGALPTIVDLKCETPYAVLGCAWGELPLVASGYAVLVPQLRGNGGIEPVSPLRDYMKTPNEDALAGVDLLIQRGIADGTRLGVYGLSQGGARTSGMITMTTRFKAAVVREAAYGAWEGNLLRPAIRESNSPYWRELISYGAPQGDVYDPQDLARLIVESPALNLNRVRTPTLLLFGAHSEAPGSGRILFGGLQRFGVPSEFVVYDEGHGFFRPAAVVDYLTRTVAWFDYWLKDMPYADGARQRDYDAWKRQTQRANETRRPR